MKRYLLILVAFVAACGDSNAPESGGTATFVIQVSGEQFRARVTDAAQIVNLRQRLAAGTTGVLSGTLVEGSGGFNTGWGWHLDPETVHAADMAIEVCDGRPSMVEADLDYWIDSVKQFCPWGARVIAED